MFLSVLPFGCLCHLQDMCERMLSGLEQAGHNCEVLCSKDASHDRSYMTDLMAVYHVLCVMQVCLQINTNYNKPEISLQVFPSEVTVGVLTQAQAANYVQYMRSLRLGTSRGQK